MTLNLYNELPVEELYKRIRDDLTAIDQLYDRKQKEYAGANAFHNFYEGGIISGQFPTDVLDGFLMKHYVSYRDILKKIREGEVQNPAYIDEKFNDIILYFLLQKHLIKHNFSTL